MKKGDKYMSGLIDLGILGQQRILIFKNNNKKSEKSPDYRMVVPTEGDDDPNIQAGVLWVKKKGESSDSPPDF